MTIKEIYEWAKEHKAENAEVVFADGWSQLLYNTVQDVTIDFDNKRGRQVLVLWDET